MDKNNKFDINKDFRTLNFPMPTQMINLKSGTDLKNLKPINSNIDSFIKYSKSFVDEEDFKGKRLFRYVNKVKNFIFEQLYKVYPQIKQDCPSVVDFNTLCLGFLSKQYLPQECVKTYDGLQIFIHQNIVQNIDTSLCNNDILEQMFTNPSKALDVIDVSFYDIIDYELTYIVMEYLRWRSLKENDITKSNFSSFMPSTIIEALELFKSLIVLVCYDIDKICYSNVNQSFLDVLQSDLIKSLNVEYEKMDNQLQETLQELEKSNSMTKRLQDSILAKDNNFKQQTEHLYDAIDELERKNQKLKKKYIGLVEKYNRLKNQTNKSNNITNNNVENNETTNEDVVDVDINGKYLFVIGNGATFKGIIKDAFPNADFMNDNCSINKGVYDMVIIITSHIDHSTYFAMRDQCKNKGIPCIHCDYSNVDRIKNTMFDFLNRKTRN